MQIPNEGQSNDQFRLQNSRVFCEPERRGQYSNERSRAGVETARKAGKYASHARITLMVLRAFRIGKKKRLFCSLTFIFMKCQLEFN